MELCDELSDKTDIFLNLSTASLIGFFGQKKSKLTWSGTLNDLKTLVSTIIDEKAAESAVWRSPSGGKWCFTCEDLEITWHSKSGAIIFDGVKAGNLVKRIKDILSKPDDAVKTINSDLNMEANTDRDSSRIIENEVSSHNSTCSVVIEGIKLEMVILETRLLNTIKDNKSDICSLKFKVKDLEGVIRHKDDAILKLSEDNLILKSKLSSFENLTYKVICHDHVNNERANESASTTQVNDQCGFHDKDQLTNLNANNSRFIETSTKENPSLLNSTQVPDPHEKQRLTIDLATQRKERINIMTNVVNDQCGSQDKDQPTNLSINNPSFNEISTNENRSLLNSTQVPDSHDNQRVTIDLTTKPKEGVNIIYNPQPDNENNLGNNRHPRAKHNTPCPFLRRRGWCAMNRNNISRLPSFLLINARSLLPKIIELSLLLSIHPIGFIAVTETWLNDTVPEQLIYINNYNIFRNDRSNSRGGGVCAFISANIPAKRMDLENPSHECLWLWLRPHRLPRHLTGLICCVLYNPPDTPANEKKELTAYLIDQIDRVRCTHPDCDVILLGDFNNLDISDLLCHHNLTQIVDTPTREGNILDLIVTKLEALYSKPVIIAPLGSSDHNIVKCSAKTNVLRTDNKTIKKNIRSFPTSARAAFGRWCCSREWFSDAESKNSATALASSFTNELNSAVDRLFPSKVIRIHNSDKPWMTPALKKLIYQRQKAFHSGSLDLWRHYRLKVRNDIGVKKRAYYTNKVQHLNPVTPENGGTVLTRCPEKKDLQPITSRSLRMVPLYLVKISPNHLTPIS